MMSKRIVLLLFFGVTLITYYSTIGAGFVFDFLGWQRVYDLGSFADILNCFGYHGNHQTLHFFFYSIYKIFHINGLAWYLVFCCLHAINGWLLFLLLHAMTRHWNIQSQKWMLPFITLIFLLHPYCVEVVVWKACLHYLLSLTAILLLFLMVTQYLQDVNRRKLWFAWAIYFLSLFLLELSYISPVVITVFLGIDACASKSRTTLRQKFIAGGGFWGLLVAGLLINRLTLVAWVGHYGAETHLRIDVLGMMATELKYWTKHLFDARYFPFDLKNQMFDVVLSNPELVFFSMVAIISIALLYIIRIRKFSGNIHLGFFAIVASSLYILPVSNLFFYHLLLGTNDRFSYVPLVFCLVAIFALLSKTSKWIWIPVLSIFLLLQIYLQQHTVLQWHQSSKVLHSLRDSFQWHDRSHVFVLNSPDNLNGIVMTSVRDVPSGIEELLDYQTNRPFDGEMFDVLQYNMTSPNDGVTVEQTGPRELTVTFKQWGNWWHHRGQGASVYENEYYKAEVLHYPYRLTFKQLPPESAIIYQDGSEWKEFEFRLDTIR